ncbi:MAG: hypothetical protein AAFW46_12765 [Pseudomonadota bacterium]
MKAPATAKRFMKDLEAQDLHAMLREEMALALAARAQSRPSATLWDDLRELVGFAAMSARPTASAGDRARF